MTKQSINVPTAPPAAVVFNPAYQPDSAIIPGTGDGLVSFMQKCKDNFDQLFASLLRKTASYTLVLLDAGQHIDMNSGSANNLTVPPNVDVAFAIDDEILVSQYGAGQTTIVAGAGVTIRSKGGALKLTGQYSAATLKKIGTNEWYLFGDITT